MNEMNPTVASMAAICINTEITNIYFLPFLNLSMSCTAAKTGRKRKYTIAPAMRIIGKELMGSASIFPPKRQV
jgi:hypothetical protein